MSEQNAIEIGKVAELAASGLAIKTVRLPQKGLFHNERHFIVIPDGHTVSDLTEMMPDAPQFVARKAGFNEVEDFMDYVRRFANVDTSVYFNVDELTFVAVIDHDTPGEASRGAHRAMCRLQRSEQWDTWSKASGSFKSQDEFADWLEENELDIQDPDGATVLEAVRALRLSSKVEFQRIVNDANGAINLVYEDDVRQTGNVSLPEKLVVPLQVFRGVAPIAVTFLLRYRLRSGAVSLCVKAPRLRAMLREQADMAYQTVATGLSGSAHVYRGIHD